MQVDCFTTGPIATNAYLLTCTQTKQCALIDPAPGSAKPFNTLIEKRALRPVAILLTHSHWDHIADAATLKEQWQIPVSVHPADAPNLQSPGADGLPQLLELEGVDPDHLLREGEEIAVGELRLIVIETPGHSAGGVCFHLPAEGVLFSGDTLFQGCFGKISFPTSHPEKMGPSLERIALLPPETVIYPGHGRKTTVREEGWLREIKSTYPNIYPEGE